MVVVYVSLRVCLTVYLSIYIYLYLSIYLSIYLYVYICMYLYMYYIYLYIRTYKHTRNIQFSGMACFSFAAFSLVLCHALVLLQDCKALRWPFKVVDQGDGAAGIQVV